jgi:hypothetical protein
MKSIDISPLTIKYKGLFDFNVLYNVMVQWLKSRKYLFIEKSYKHKVPSPLGAEQEIEFAAERKVTELLMEKIGIEMKLWDMTEVEVIKDGLTKKLTNARIRIIIKGSLVLDYEDRYKKSKVAKFAFGMYLKFFGKHEIGAWWDQLSYRMHKLHEIIKQELDMQSKGYEYAGYLGDNI